MGAGKGKLAGINGGGEEPGREKPQPPGDIPTRKERNMSVCPVLSTPTVDVKCRSDCAWYKKSAVPKGGQCAVLWLNKWVEKMANPTAKVT